jgi:hypothetical protein
MHNQPAPARTARGFVVETGQVPTAFPARLEEAGMAAMCAQTVDGVYLECRAPLEVVLQAFARAGIQVRDIRAAGTPPSWRDGVRSPAQAQARLRNMRAAAWLPTLPAA